MYGRVFIRALAFLHVRVSPCVSNMHGRDDLGERTQMRASV